MVAVTAGAGFIGSALCAAYAARGDEVRCLDRPDRIGRLPARVPGVDYLEYGLGGRPERLREQLGGVDVLVHLAHKGLPSSPSAQTASDAATTIGGTLELLEAARDRRVGRVVFGSSGGTVYGRVGAGPVAEDHVCAPISAYGVAKLAVEHYLRLYDDVHGLPAVSLRIGNATGPAQFRGAGVGAVAKFLALASVGQPIEVWGDGGVVRDYVYIDDIVTAFLLASSPEVPTGVYNIGSGHGASLSEVVAAVRATTGLRVDVVHRPARGFDVPAVVLDCHRFTAATGWSATVGLEQAVQRMWVALQQLPPAGRTP